MTPADARQAALGLPGVVKADHHGRPSFRHGGRVIATVPATGVLNVMVDEAEARAAVDSDPTAFALVWWGKRVAAVQVRLAHVAPTELLELLQLATCRGQSARRGQAGASDPVGDRRLLP